MAQLEIDDLRQIEIFEFLKSNKNLFDSISDNFKCVICKTILVDPQFLLCGCEACKICLDEYLKTNKFCPELNNDCKAHQIEMKDVISSSITRLKINKLKISCFKNDCDYEGKIEDLVNHIKTCDFKSGSLKRFSERTNLEENVSENMGVPFKLLVEMNQNLKNEIMDELKSDKMNLVENKDEVSGAKSMIKTKENEEHDKLKDMITFVYELCKREIYDELYDVIKHNEDRINDISSYVITGDKYEWTIRNIVGRLRNGPSHEYTEVFEIRYGYNIRLHFKFNSDREINEPHFSVFCQFVAGPHDGELDWPCTETVCFGLKSVGHGFNENFYLNFDPKDEYFSERPEHYGIEKRINFYFTLSYLERNNLITNRGNLLTYCKSIF